MESHTLLSALILGVVEGLTEFLPISSTGHLILAGDLLGFNDEKGKVFHVAIQTGAMLAVVWEYRARFKSVIAGLFTVPEARRFAVKLFAAFLPAVVLGLLFGGLIKRHLFAAVPVSLAFIAGAFVIFWAESRRNRVRVENVDAMTTLDAFKVGLAQCFALIPGVSRSGATIIGGMLLGLSRRAATEFSFFLAVPTLVAAGVYDVYDHRALFSFADLPTFAVGGAVSFVSAFLCIRWLIRYISRHDFRPFAWYRIAFGAVVLLTAWTGWVEWSNG